MSTGLRRSIADVLPIAQKLREQLAPACHRIEIAGSLRRQVREVADIELVAIPAIETLNEPVPGDLFGARHDRTYNRLWEALDGFLGGKYLKAGEKYRAFVLPSEGIKVDLFTATRDNWGWIYLIRTGSAEFSHHVAKSLNRQGYTSDEGSIHRATFAVDPKDGRARMIPVGEPIATPAEEDVFDLAGVLYREPQQRH